IFWAHHPPGSESRFHPFRGIGSLLSSKGPGQPKPVCSTRLVVVSAPRNVKSGFFFLILQPQKIEQWRHLQVRTQAEVPSLWLLVLQHSVLE
ncbi:hypothetical protein LINGRAHAP2_LOCUS10063, partial [Linum grandiflorum]